MNEAGLLVVFCGLPGVGKTRLARAVAARLGATFLRIDTIEAAISTALVPIGHSSAGYAVANRVAADQLCAGRAVVVDAVNNLAVIRSGWVDLAVECGAPLRLVEVICSDPAEHRRRAEVRTGEMPGHHVPTWEEIERRPWEPIGGPHLTIDNLGEPSRHVDTVCAWIAG